MSVIAVLLMAMEGEEMVVGLEESLKELRETFQRGKTRSASWRKSQLWALLKLLEEKEDEMFKALNKDLGKHHVESFRDEVPTTQNFPFFSLAVSIIIFLSFVSSIWVVLKSSPIYIYRKTISYLSLSNFC